MKIICWQATVDQLWSSTWKAFQSTVDEPLFFVIRSYSNPNRKKYGWKAEDLTEFQLTMLNQKSWWRQGKEIIDTNPEAIHVFLSFWGSRQFFPLILYASWRGAKVAVINETYSTSLTGYFTEEPLVLSWFKAKVRPLLYRLASIVLKVVSKDKPPCILALSLLAQEQFLNAGFDKKTVFPFGYFIARRPVKNLSNNDERDILRLIFVGTLLKRKGLDIVVDVVEGLNRFGVGVSLDVYGPGQPELFISSASKCVQYKGLLVQEEVQEAIAKYDALILPSRHDGWGVVVNEALLQGVPVIVSDQVGAKCLVESTGAGLIFTSQDKYDLASHLEKLALNSDLLCKIKSRASFTKEHIQPETGAAYLKNVFDFYFSDSGGKPRAIWCGDDI